MSILRFNDDYMHQGQVMKTADRKLLHYICSAAYHLRAAEELMADYNDLKHLSYYKGMCEKWPDMARLYKQLAQADTAAALVLVSDLEDVGLLDYGDWLNISHTLNWFGIPAEDRYD